MSLSDNYEAHYLAIGRMLVMFQSMEATLKDGLVLLMNNELGKPSGQLVYATVSELSFGTAARIASAIPSVYTVERIGAKDDTSRLRLTKELAESEQLLKNGIKLASEAEQRRNQLVHSRWFISNGIELTTGKMMRMKTKTKTGSMSVSIETESLSDVDSNTEKARQAQQMIGGALHNYQQISKFTW